MAVVFRNFSNVIGTGTSPTVTEPTGAANGDVLLYLAVFQTGPVTQPSGWTSLYSGSAPTLFQFTVGYQIRSGAPNLTWTYSGSQYREVIVICLNSNTAASLTLDSQSASGATGNGTNHAIDPPSTTAVASASMAVSGGVWWTGSAAGGYTASAGYTIRDTNAAGSDCVVQTKSLSASGAENPGTVGNSAAGSSDFWDGFTVTFAEVAAASAILMGAACL